MGEPTSGLAMGNLEGKGRALAIMEAESHVIENMASIELVGKKIPVKHDQKKKINKLILSD